MKRKTIKLFLFGIYPILLVSCGQSTSTSTSSSSSFVSSSTETTTSSSSSSSSNTVLPEGETIDAYIQALEIIRDADSYTLTYTVDEVSTVDKYNKDYMLVGDSGGYIELPSYNQLDPLLGNSTVLYSFVYEDNEPVLSLPVTNSTYEGMSVAHTLEEVNYISKAFKEETPLSKDVLSIDDNNNVVIDNKGASWAYDDILKDFASTFHRTVSLASKLIFTKDSYSLSFELQDYWGDSYYGTISDINATEDETIAEFAEKSKIPNTYLPYSSLNNLRSNTFFATSNVITYDSNNEVYANLGTVELTKTINAASWIQKDEDGNIETYQVEQRKDDKVYLAYIDPFNEFQSTEVSYYTWDEIYQDLSTVTDSEAFRLVNEEDLTFEYFGLYASEILSGITCLDTSNYGYLRHLYLNLDPETYQVSTITGVFGEIEGTSGAKYHIEISTSLGETPSSVELPAPNETVVDEDFDSAYAKLDGTTSYKATITSSGNVTTIGYYDASLKTLLLENYTYSDEERTLESVEGYKFIEEGTPTGATPFSYDTTTNTAKATSAPSSKTLQQMQIFGMDPKVFIKNSEGNYVLDYKVQNASSAINYQHGDSYYDGTLEIKLDGNKQISQINLTVLDFWSEAEDIVKFDFDVTSPIPATYTDAINSLEPWKDPTTWKEYDSSIYESMVSYLGSEELADLVPFLYSPLINSWYFSSWSGNFYPSNYDMTDSQKEEYLESYTKLITEGPSWTYEGTDDNNKPIYSKNGLTLKIGSSLGDGFYVSTSNTQA